MVTSGARLIVLVTVCIGSYSNAAYCRSMQHFVQVLEHIEEQNPAVEPLHVLRNIRRAARLDSAYIHLFLGDPEGDLTREVFIKSLDDEISSFLADMLHHRLKDNRQEDGVVSGGDGTTVALEPLLLGLEAGLLGNQLGINALTYAKELGLAFLRFPDSLENLGAEGTWTNPNSSSEIYVLLTQQSAVPTVTDAFINGALDGALLGHELCDHSKRPARLSSLLSQYYLYRLDSRGIDAAPRLISARRRHNFDELVVISDMQETVLESLKWHWKVKGQAPLLEAEEKVEKGLQEFIKTYVACPRIISRSSWKAAPYRGTPTQLKFPLTYWFIHHTYEPSKPCMSFEECAADMRSMQSYHQNTNGWDDIGYSFVAGGDGYLYEGRSWNWVGAHTKGYNSQGYGISVIGDYTSTTPASYVITLIKDQLPGCAVRNKHLLSNYTVKGHRQMVNTECPGNAFYKEMKSWPHWKA